MKNWLPKSNSLLIFIAMLILIGCNNSPRGIITTGDKWVLSNTDKIDASKVGQEMSFNESSVSLIEENKTSDIKWIDKTSYSQDFNGKNGIVKMRKLSASIIEVAFIFNSDNIPQNESDWEKLRSENQINYLIRKESVKKEKIYKYYKVGDNSIPVDKVPPAGFYLWKNRDGEVNYVINVIIKDGIVKFQTGENKNSLVDDAATMSESGGISFASVFGSGKRYVGNGVIEDSGLMFNGMSGRTIEFIKETSTDNKNDENNLLSEVFGNFNNGKAKIEYNEFKTLLDRQYAEYSSYFQNLIIEVDYEHLLNTNKYNYPFDIKVILFKIYPNNARKSYLEQDRLTSIGGVVFEKRYGTWTLINKNFILVPINPNACYRTMYQMNPIDDRGHGTIQLRYYETYTFAIGSFNHADITYSFGPYLEEVSILKQTTR